MYNKIFPYQELNLRERELRQDLLPCLKEKVFHITPYLRFLSIINSGMLKPNMPLSPIGRVNSFARHRKWISFFDLRNKDDSIINDSLNKLDFLVPHQFKCRCLYFFLSEESYPMLIEDPPDCDYRKYMRVPEVESYYPEALPLNQISFVLDVKVIKTKDFYERILLKALKENLLDL